MFTCDRCVTTSAKYDNDYNQYLALVAKYDNDYNQFLALVQLALSIWEIVQNTILYTASCVTYETCVTTSVSASCVTCDTCDRTSAKYMKNCQYTILLSAICVTCDTCITTSDKYENDFNQYSAQVSAKYMRFFYKYYTI